MITRRKAEMMKVLLAVAVLLALAVPALAAPPALNLEIVSGGPVYVAPVRDATPFVGGLLVLNLPSKWGVWTDYLKPAAVLKTAGVTGKLSGAPALAFPVSINGAPAVMVGVTYIPNGERLCGFAGIDLVAALGALR